MRPVLTINILLTVWGCGSQREVEPKAPVPVPTVQPTPGPGGQTSFADVQAITKDYCLRCHSTAPFLQSEAGWKGSQAKTRVSNQSMPPPGTAEARNLSATDRQKLVSF